MPVSPARAAAFDILLRVERDNAYASELLHSANYRHFSRSDHALTTELTLGVLRWRSRLDEEISAASSQPLSKIDLEVLIALRIGLYQFRHLDRIPPRAAINESVELVKRARKRSAAAFANAVLRKLSNAPELNEDESSARALATKFAHPLWLIERWENEYGLAATRALCKYNQSIPAVNVRVRTSNGANESERVALKPGALLSSARTAAADVTKTSAFLSGQLAIQDEGSQLVAALVGLGKNILDCCAAPGGKTLAIADRNPQAQVTAVELHPHRARLLKQLLHAANPNVEIITADARHLPTQQLFDRILVDAPCTGTGTLARNPEIKWRLKPDDLQELQTRQREILRSALAHLAPGGRLIYSTCSLEKEENQEVIEGVMKKVDVLTKQTEGGLLKPDVGLSGAMCPFG